MSAVTCEELHAAWLQVRQIPHLKEPPIPKTPVLTSKTSVKAKLEAIQQYICALEYNYTGSPYFDISKKNRSFKSMVMTAKEIVTEALPIQCLEAVFLGAYLTAGIQELDRFPLSFKSVAGTSVHRHIVLVVRHQNKWGAIGLSRSDRLMYKELKYSTLSDLLMEFQKSFQTVFHQLNKIYLGFPFSHDIHSSEKIEWRILNLPLVNVKWKEVAAQMDTFTREATTLYAHKRARGNLPDNFMKRYPLHQPCDEEDKGKSVVKKLPFDNNQDRRPSFSTISPPLTERMEQNDPKENQMNTKPIFPVTMTPSRLVFKREAPVNILLHNASNAQEFRIEGEDKSNHLEFVCIESMTDDSTSKGTFTISSNGIIAIGMRLRRPIVRATIPSTVPSMPTQDNSNSLPEVDSIQIFDTSSQVITFKCIPVVLPSGALSNGLPPFTLQLPYEIIQ